MKPFAASPLGELVRLIAAAQQPSPLNRVTVVVPTSWARVHLRRALGTERGLCNVVFRPIDDLVSELARPQLETGRAATVPIVRESLRQVLLDSAGGRRTALANSPRAVAELATVLRSLWLADPDTVETLRRSEDGADLLSLLDAVSLHLSGHGYVNPGELVEAAGQTEDPAGTLGSLILWRLPILAGRHRRLLALLAARGTTVVDAPGTNEEPGAGIRIISCSDPDEEVRAVVRRLLRESDRGVPLWRMAVLHPRGDRYRRIVHQQLALAGVPVSGTAPVALAESASGRAALGLLGLASGKWRRDDVIRWLGSAPISVPPHNTRAPVDRWDDVSARAGVVESLQQWADRLGHFARGAPGRPDHAARNDVESHAARRLADFVAELALEADPGDRRRWSDFSIWTRRLLDLYLRPEDGAADWPATERVAADDVRRVIEDLAALDGVAAATDLAWFRHTVEAELASRRMRRDDDADEPAAGGDVRVLPGPTGSGVFVGSFADARGLFFDHCFVIGLADGFAPAYIEEGLLPDLGDESPPDWPTMLKRQAEQRSDFVQALASSNEPTVVSWPRVDPRTGRELTRSRWLDGRPDGEQVDSFEAGLRSVRRDGGAASGADRRLAFLAGASTEDLAGHPLSESEDTGDALVGIPLGDAFAAALARQQPAFSRFDGYVGAIGTEEAGIDRELSPTRLEQYAHCPRRFLLDRQLHVLAPFRPEANEQMEPRDRGTLTHAILEAYVRERIDTGAPASLERLLELGEAQFAQADAEGRCGMPLMAHVERMTLMRELRRFYEEDILAPIAVELRFGGAAARHDVADDRLDVGGADPSEPALPPLEVSLADGRLLHFGGSIDRVDRADDGTVVVSDYKTGLQRDLAKLTKDPVAGGTKLQLPIYALAARAFVDKPGQVLARYWLTSWKRNAPSYACGLSAALEERTREVMQLIVSGIESGSFPGVPGEADTRPGYTFDNCRHCDFDRLCPTDRDRRWSSIRRTEPAAVIVQLKEAEPPAGTDGLIQARVLRSDEEDG
jgi:ATP-dependent helicase/nuclease subunit B